MPAVLIQFKDLSKTLVSKAKPECIELRKVEFILYYPSEKEIVKALDEDPLLLQEMQDVAKNEYDRLERQMVMLLKGHDKKIKEAAGDTKKCEKLVDEFEKIFDEQISTNMTFAQKNIKKVWEKYAAKKTQYKKYKWKAGAKLGTAVASLTASVAVMASTPFTGGATAVVGIAGMVKTAGGIAKQCYELAIEVEKAQKNLNETLKIVKKNYEKAGGKKIGAMETGAMVFEKLFVVELPSIKKAENQLKLVDNKLAGVIVKSHDFAKTLQKALKAVDKLEKEMKTKKIATKKLEAVEDKIDSLIAKTMDNVKRAKKADKAFSAASTVVAELVKKKPGALEYIEKGMVLLDFALSTSWEDVVQTASEIVVDTTVDKIIDKAVK